MGSGKRIDWWRGDSWEIGGLISHFPFAITITLVVGYWTLKLGLGKAYDK
jgi:hypothetical protein